MTSVDPSQIGDALLNLALNARDAMPHGGGLAISTANVHLDVPDSAMIDPPAAGDYVALAVSDTGIGMPSCVAERATEPFFSTKPVGSGSGLGLSMIYGFARQSGGHLVIGSEVGVGTTVTLYLPRAPNTGDAALNSPDEEVVMTGGDEAILLVDDNLTLRNVTQRHLSALGYSVGLADNGPQALALLRSGPKFDLLLTDIMMPEGMNGYALATAARNIFPICGCCSPPAMPARPATVNLAKPMSCASRISGRNLRTACARRWTSHESWSAAMRRCPQCAAELVLSPHGTARADHSG